MARRGPPVAVDWPMSDLGRTHDNAYVQRVVSIFTGAHKAAQHPDILRKCDVIYARNLDMLAVAARVKAKLKLTAPLVYECLDIHHRLSGDSKAAQLFRKIEARLLAQTALVIVSSPRFEIEHFRRYYPGGYRHMLIENRLIDAPDLPKRQEREAPSTTEPLRIGWFGNLRCRTSFDLLTQLLRRYPGQVTVTLRGYPAKSVFPDLKAEVDRIDGMTYYGPYKAPDDLQDIYDGVDLVWACDWYERGANSLWLLPNRLYEGGYFGTPALVAADTETARWVKAHGTGLVLQEPIAQTLNEQIGLILEDRSRLAQMYRDLSNVHRRAFVEPAMMMQDMFVELGIDPN
jgi:succinoglycan biosynthesis protein ExoL